MVKGARMAGGTVGALTLGNAFLSPQRVLSADVEFSESNQTAKRPIKKMILIAYASFCGTTAGVAQAIGRVLSDQGAKVEVRLLKNVNDVSSYDGAVLGQFGPECFLVARSRRLRGKEQRTIERDSGGLFFNLPGFI